MPKRKTTSRVSPAPRPDLDRFLAEFGSQPDVAANELSRRQFLRQVGLASGAVALTPLLVESLATVAQGAADSTRVWKTKNGDCFQNTAKLWDMLGGPAKYIGADDIVVIKANAQWPNQGYTHTGCIKGVIDKILEIPGFAGEILICDNVTTNDIAGQLGFDATTSYRTHNWPNHNWNSLAAEYQASGKPVAAKKWAQGSWRAITFPGVSGWNPADGDGWVRSFFTYNGRPTYLSYPIFQSPLTSGRMIDMKNGVWEKGGYTGRKVKAIFMPTLNNHGSGSEDYAGVTSAIKSFFGATEINTTENATWNGYYHIHASSFAQGSAQSAGELVGKYIKEMYAPVLYIAAAMWSGSQNRTGSGSSDAVETKTVLACENPVTLDFISCRDVISPYASWLDPTQSNNTRKQMLGCNSQGIGTLDTTKMEVIAYDFNHPTATRLDIDRKIRDFQAGKATAQEVKDVLNLYMTNR
jgi:hypothetical protein